MDAHQIVLTPYRLRIILQALEVAMIDATENKRKEYEWVLNELKRIN